MSDMRDMRDMRGGSPVADGGTMDTTATTSGTSDEALRLDGNAAVGVLAEIFAVEMTGAQVTCAHCGHAGPFGSLMLYGGQIGTILRCPTCDAVQLRVVRVPEWGGQHGQCWMDMRGMTVLRVALSTPA